MRISGLNSGLDIEQIVSDLVRAQRIPMDRVYQQKVRTEWKRDAYREVNTKLSRLSNFVFDMTLQGTYQRNVATSSHPNILTVNATGAAQAGSYELTVEKLATAARFAATGVTLPENGTFSIGVEIDGEAGQAIEINVEQHNSLEKIASEINKNHDLGILAFVHEDSISFTSRATGADVAIVLDSETIDLKGMFGEGVETRVTGTDAVVNVNGIEIKQSGNTLDLNGVTVNLLEADENTKVRVEVRQDVDAVVDKIKEFVELYNEIVDEVNLKLREETFRDYPPLTKEQKEAMSDKEIELWEERARSGLLRSDPLLSRVLSEMRMALGGVVQNLEGEHNSLAQIGISTGSWYEYGRLNLNEGKLRAAIEEDPNGVRDLFTKRSDDSEEEQGIARRLDTVLKNAMAQIKETAGEVHKPYDDSALGNRIRDFEERLTVMEERLMRFEEAQWRKFTAMERVLGQLYSQSDWLYQQLTAMQG